MKYILRIPQDDLIGLKILPSAKNYLSKQNPIPQFGRCWQWHFWFSRSLSTPRTVSSARSSPISIFLGHHIGKWVPRRIRSVAQPCALSASEDDFWRKPGWTFPATGLDSPTAAAYGATENPGHSMREVLNHNEMFSIGYNMDLFRSITDI